MLSFGTMMFSINSLELTNSDNSIIKKYILSMNGRTKHNKLNGYAINVTKGT